MSTETSRFPLPKTFLLGFGFFGVSVIWAIYNAFVPVFLESKFGLAPAWIGFFLTLDNFAALLIQPLVGAWSDKIRTPIGRRMPFILVGAPLGAVAFGFLPLAPILPLFVLCTTTLIASMALWRTPVVALMPDLVPSRFRSQANSIINLMGGVGAIAAYFVGARLYDQNPNFPFWLGAALVVGATLLLFLFIREPKVPLEAQEAAPGMLESVISLFHEREKSPLFMLLALFCWTVGYTAIEGFWTLYCVNHLRISASQGTMLLGGLSLVFVLAALPAGFLAELFSRRALIGTGLIGLSAILATIFFLPVTLLTTPLFSIPILGAVPIVGALLMFAGVMWALITIHALPMVVDMTSAARLGTYTGLYYGFSTLAAIVGPNVNGWVAQISGSYNTILLAAPFWMIAGFMLLLKVRRGEAI